MTEISARSKWSLPTGGRAIRLAAVALAGLWLAGAGAANAQHPLAGRIFEVATAAEIDEAALAGRLGAAGLIILGEVHDNPLHHQAQARLVALLVPGGIAFEQIPEKDEGTVNDLLAGGTPPGEIGAAIGWDDLGWPDWAHYAPIIAASPGAWVAGGGVGRDELMAAIGDGAASAWGAEAADWGLGRELAPAMRAEAEAEMIASHCGMLPESAAPGMVEAQRLRDARFAAALLRAWAAGGTGRAVLITGNGHARRDRGVPLYLGAKVPGMAVLSVGMVEVAEGAAAPGDYPLPYDFVIFTEPAERPDPCAGFGKG